MQPYNSATDTGDGWLASAPHIAQNLNSTALPVDSVRCQMTGMSFALGKRQRLKLAVNGKQKESTERLAGLDVRCELKAKVPWD